MPRLLIVTAVEDEADAIGAPQGAEVLIGGVGPAASAAATSAALARGSYDLVISAGIGGGFAALQPGDIAVAAEVVFADLGAETADGFESVAALGFGRNRYPVNSEVAERLLALTDGRLGSVLTVATVTGSALTAAQLVRRFPYAVAEAMEGAGVAAAALAHDVPFAEVRAISNVVGPRDRDAWQIEAALTALGAAIGRVVAGWSA